VEGIYLAHIFIPDGVRVVVQANGPSGQEFLHVFHVKTPASPPAYADLVTMSDAFHSWLINDYKNMWASDIQAVQIVLTSMASAPGPQYTLGEAVPGVRAGDTNPSEITLAIKATTHNSGRSNRGRQYAWPAVAFDIDTNDRYTDAYKTAIVGVFNSLVARVQSSGYLLGVGSLHDAAVKPIASYVAVDRTIDSQRRRTAGRGR